MLLTRIGGNASDDYTLWQLIYNIFFVYFCVSILKTNGFRKQQYSRSPNHANKKTRIYLFNPFIKDINYCWFATDRSHHSLADSTSEWRECGECGESRLADNTDNKRTINKKIAGTPLVRHNRHPLRRTGRAVHQIIRYQLHTCASLAANNETDWPWLTCSLLNPHLTRLMLALNARTTKGQSSKR